MKVAANHVVELEYHLYIDGPEGEHVESTNVDEPFTFLFGHEEVLEKLTEALGGLELGADFKVSLPCADAYGELDPSAVASFAKSVFEIDGELDEEAIAEGELVPMRDEDGNELDGFVIENTADGVTLDFNHPLAGENLYFEGRILSIRPATEAELEAGEASAAL